MTPTASANNPGELGGGSAPDLFFTGLVQATGLIVNGGGSGTNQLVVNGSTEDSGGLAATSGWGGSGMTFGSTPNSATFTPLFDTSTIHATGDAYNTDTLSATAVADSNNFIGALLQTNISGGFSNPSATSPAITLNSGDQTGVQASGTYVGEADDITATLSATLHFLVNGGNPPAPASPP